MGAVTRILREARSLALRKRPEKDPLIVETGYYDKAVRTEEIPGVVVKAPFGSGKTFGIGLKAYHDSRSSRPPMDVYKVVLVKSRDLLERDSAFAKVVAQAGQRLSCGGMYLAPLWYLAATQGGKCLDPNDTSCYTTLTRDEIRAMAGLLRRLSPEKPLRPDLFSETLSRIKEEVLGGRDLTVIIDEVEGFLSMGVLSPDWAGELVYGNLAMMSKVYDYSVWGMKLVMLVQSRVIEPEWRSLVERVKEGAPYYSPARTDRPVGGRASIYHCPGGDARIDVSAVMGRVNLISMEYYQGDVYAEYAENAMRRVAEELENAGIEKYRSLSRTARKYADQLSDFYVRRDAAKKLAFLETVAPRIGFDYMDELVEFILMNGSGNVLQAIDRVLRIVAEEWSRYMDIRRYYSLIVMKNIDPQFRRQRKSVAQYIAAEEDFSVVARDLARDVYGRVFEKLGVSRGYLHPKITRYHSNYIAAVTLPSPAATYVGVLVLRITPSRPSPGSAGRFSERLAKHVWSVVGRDLATTASRARKRTSTSLYVTGLMLVPEDTAHPTYLELDTMFSRAIASVASEISGGRGVPRVASLLEKLRDEDLIIVAWRSLTSSRGRESLSLEEQFVEERYKDIVNSLSGKILEVLEAGG